jgi:hypothetical protein
MTEANNGEDNWLVWGLGVTPHQIRFQRESHSFAGTFARNEIIGSLAIERDVIF